MPQCPIAGDATASYMYVPEIYYLVYHQNVIYLLACPELSSKKVHQSAAK